MIKNTSKIDLLKKKYRCSAKHINVKLNTEVKSKLVNIF